MQKTLAVVCDCALNIQELNAQNGAVEEIDKNAGVILSCAQEIADKN